MNYGKMINELEKVLEKVNDEKAINLIYKIQKQLSDEIIKESEK